MDDQILTKNVERNIWESSMRIYRFRPLDWNETTVCGSRLIKVEYSIIYKKMNCMRSQQWLVLSLNCSMVRHFQRCLDHVFWESEKRLTIAFQKQWSIFEAKLILEGPFYLSKEICFIWTLYSCKLLQSNVMTKSFACQVNEACGVSDPRIPVVVIEVLKQLNAPFCRFKSFIIAWHLCESSRFIITAVFPNAILIITKLCGVFENIIAIL